MSAFFDLIDAPAAPKAIGPYSHAARIGNLLYCSGQIPLDPATMKLVEGGIEEQTRQVLANVASVLASQGATLANVAKTTIFLAKSLNYSSSLSNAKLAHFYHFKDVLNS